MVQARPPGAAFLRIDPSARSYALGEASAVGAQGAQALSGNPAFLGQSSGRFELFSAYAGLLGGAHYGHVALSLAREASYAFPLEGVGISITHVGIGGLEGRDTAGNRTGGSFGARDVAVGVGGALRLAPGVRLGGVFKALRSEIASYASGVSLAGDAGIALSPHRNMPLTFGLAVRNLGQGQRFISQRDPLPLSLHAGLAYRPNPVSFFLEVGHAVHSARTHAGLGMEVGLGAVELRAGFRREGGEGENLALQAQEGMERLMQALTGGIGLRLGSTQVDYALGQQAVEWGLSHRLTLTVRWGGAGRDSGNLYEP